MSKFKVGDRVVVTNAPDGNESIVGKTGIVRHNPESRGWNYTIGFPSATKRMHAKCWHDGDHEARWVIPADKLKLAPEKKTKAKPVTFKVGDRVRFKNLPKTYWFKDGEEGTITEVEGSWIDVRVDPYEDKERDHGKLAYVDPTQIEHVPQPVAKDETAPTVADDLRLPPRSKTILAHLKTGKSISPAEAFTVYGNMRLAAAIHEIRKAGYDVKGEMRRDRSGHGYMRYELAA